MFADYLLITIPLLPLTLALLIPLFRSGIPMTLAPLMALLAAFLVPVNSSVHLPWVLTGVHWQLDNISQLFLIFSSLIWLVVSLYVAFEQNPQTKRTAYLPLFFYARHGR